MKMIRQSDVGCQTSQNFNQSGQNYRNKLVHTLINFNAGVSYAM